MTAGPIPARLARAELPAWLRMLNTEIDLALDGRPGPIPLWWLEDRLEAAYRERHRRLAAGAAR